MGYLALKEYSISQECSYDHTSLGPTDYLYLIYSPLARPITLSHPE